MPKKNQNGSYTYSFRWHIYLFTRLLVLWCHSEFANIKIDAYPEAFEHEEKCTPQSGDDGFSKNLHVHSFVFSTHLSRKRFLCTVKGVPSWDLFFFFGYSSSSQHIWKDGKQNNFVWIRMWWLTSTWEIFFYI